MSKQSLLLVDGDTRSLRVLEVSLRKAGFSVTPAASVIDALDKLELHAPDLIISETKFPTDLDGFELRRRVRAVPDWASIPFVFLTAETAIEHKIRGLELGVDDYLTKPIYIKEIVTRINILLQKRQRANFDERKDGVRFAGRVADMPVVDVIQTIEVSRKSGVIQFVADRQRSAAIFFRDGKVIDAEAGTLQGEDAVYRLLTWSEGEFEVVFRTVRRREAITASSQGLLMEGMRRLDEWSRLLEQLPPLTHRFEIDTVELSGRLGDVPDDNNPILRLIDGKRSLLEVIDASDFGDLECLQAISRLYFEGLLLDLDPEKRAKRDTGKPMPMVVLDAPTPIEEVASGPIYTDEHGRTSVPTFTERAAPEPPAPEPVPEAAPVFSGEDANLEAAAPALEPGERDLHAPDDDEIRSADELSDEVQPPLSGSYRPSSLRLIDEAVAAAQAIDPSLFESDLVAGDEPPAALARVQLATRESDPRIANARGVVDRVSAERIENPHDTVAPVSSRAKAKSRPPPLPMEAIERAIAKADASGEIAIPTDDDYSGVPTIIEAEHQPVADEDSTWRPPGLGELKRREDSGLRMIGSLGRDRAEASGELRPPPARATSASDASDSARELVTIMPRRPTRDAESRTVVAEVDDTPEPPSFALPPPPRISVAGGVRRTTGPGPLAMVLVVIASLMAGLAIYLYMHRKLGKHEVIATSFDAREVVGQADAVLPGDAVRVATIPSDGGRVDHVDAGGAADARGASRDAGAQVVARSDGGEGGGEDRAKEARALLEQAHAALEDGDPDKALQLADASLKLRKTARTYLERARALQRLGQVDEALKSVDASMEIVADYAPAWEQRGMILWAARRHDEARPALEKYLELDPNGKDVPSIRQMLGQP